MYYRLQSLRTITDPQALKAKAQEKLKEVELKIRELREIEKQLKGWVNACPGDENSDCPIIEDLTK